MRSSRDEETNSLRTRSEEAKRGSGCCRNSEQSLCLKGGTGKEVAVEKALDIQREEQSMWGKDGNIDEKVHGRKINSKTDSPGIDGGEKREEGPG